MGVLVDSVREALQEFKRTKDEFELSKKMVSIGDYSIRCQQHAGIVYAEIATLKALKKVRRKKG